MAAYPEPCDGIAFHYPESAISPTDANRPDVFLGIDAFKMQGRVKRIFRAKAIGFFHLTLDSVIHCPMATQNDGRALDFIVDRGPAVLPAPLLFPISRAEPPLPSRLEFS